MLHVHAQLDTAGESGQHRYHIDKRDDEGRRLEMKASAAASISATNDEILAGQ